MSEVVPLPSFGEVFFDARGQERCLRVTWHEGTLVLSLWRGEMCTASFRMPMDDVGRLLDTLDDGFAEATGEQPAIPAEVDPGTEVIPGTGQYHRPAQPVPQPAAPPLDERPTAALPPNDVLVARGTPGHQDKLVASYAETTVPRETAIPQYGEPQRQPYPAEPQRQPFTGPQYVDQNDPLAQPHEPFAGPHYTEQRPHYQDNPAFTGPQYTDQGTSYYTEQPQPAEPFYQMPGERPRQPMTDPLGFPSQAAPAPQQQGYYDQQPQQPQRSTGAAGLGTPMHGIPGAGRRTDPPQHEPNPVDPLLALGTQQPQHPQEPLSRPYVGDPMFSTGERLRPEQQYDERGDRREW
ncbi:hypothetical protein [Nonomuraea sediminis]|uniref:hypothetical protein n=1 Tax=Nonomuraea sediminis TaxID=2835864 RepID=UPI001BDC72DD|nr:hypothetical protein [Nonomuraea sediminis]